MTYQDMTEQARFLHSFQGMNILVTGASGFIGSMLCDRLCSQGAEVHAISRHAQNNPASVRWWQGDLGDYATVDKLFESVKPDIVFHLASEVTGGRDLKLVLPTFNANLVSTVNILVAATEHHCRRIVTAGSLEEPDERDSIAIPSSPYAAAKWSSAGYARMFHALYQTPVVTARLFMVYGPGQKDLRKLVPYVTLSLLRGESPELSSGQRPVDWIYVGDVVDGLMTMGQVPDIEGSTIELGSGNLATTREVVEMLVDMIAPDIKPLFGAVPDRPMERVRTADISAAGRMLGWQPRVSLKRGLRETIDWYRQQLESGSLEKSAGR